jgi:membrane associated rhomboid family serine protease
VFPLRDDNPTLRLPLVTVALILANGVAWIYLQGGGSAAHLARSVCEYGLITGEFLGTVARGTRVSLGEGFLCTLGGAPTWYTPLTSMFMHGSWFHIVGNLWFLWVFGNNVEDAMGRLRFVAFYVLSGLGAAAAQMASNPDATVPMVGASGAISGVMGAYLVLYPHAHVYTLVIFGFYARTVAVPAGFMLGYWFLLQLLGGVPALNAEGGGVAFWAHAGGFVAGMALVFPFRNPRLVMAQREALRRA